MSLERFFDAVGPYLTRASTIDAFREAAGPTDATDAELAFYPWLVAFDQRRILAELCVGLHGFVQATAGLDWNALVSAYIDDHPPREYPVPGVGAHLADWLAARRRVHPDQPEALECLADLAYTRFLARTAPDGPGLGLDERVFLRHYPVDVLGIEAAVAEGSPIVVGTPATLVVYRHVTRLEVHTFAPSIRTLAVFAEAQGHPRQGPLADLSDEDLAAERASLVRRGVVAA